VAWDRWPALDRSIRRRHGGNCGRLRVRRGDSVVVLVSEHPFRGSREATPAEAVALASQAALDFMDTRRHSFRLLGRWADRQPPGWRLVQRLGPLDLAEVRRELEALGVRADRLKDRPDLQLLLWRCASDSEADALAARLRALAGPVTDFSHAEDFRSNGPNSDSAGAACQSADVGAPGFG
jgi:hypothetical protein